MMQVAVGGTALMAGSAALAQAPAMVDPASPQAQSLGYVADSSKVDAKKYPKHAATQLCSNCQLFVGKPTDAAGGCGIFPGKQVAGKGWCSAYVKKAG
ncbi:MAG: high-potential iron-sulfur protein [Hydrogenophaga sp.]|nr:iron permease [Comamonadaceae bacterium]MBS4036871.1 high-potential iron-sulfur protein [Hydrogenophaga sp.]